MKIKVQHLSLDQIAESGQCFRWEKTGESTYRIPYRNRMLTISQIQQNCLQADCSETEWQETWKHYFDLECDYNAFDRLITPDGGYLFRAAQASCGIRILNQDLWETMLSFVISQNNNIPKIKKTLALLCNRFGTLPSPEEIARGGLQRLDGLLLGYRQKYVLACAQKFMAEGRQLITLGQEKAQEALLDYPGVGPKVASCILLFGLGHKEAFPRDTWIRKIEQAYFDGHFPEDVYPGCAGVMQQYLFFYERQKHLTLT